ncbi:MAG: glycosyl hydrolase, partial [Phycisphaeraceae bacterium JB051]
MKIDNKLKPSDLTVAIEKVLTLAARKVKSIDKSWKPESGTPVFTVKGKYTSMGWTEWTQGFMFGNILLAGDGLDDAKLMKLGTDRTLQYMLPHVTHIGVHDHGFNNLSTYGNIIRLIREKKLKDTAGIEETCKTAVAASGAVQASRWSGVRQEFKDKHSAKTRMLGYIYSFNGPHSLFIDTMRTTRILGVA